MKSTIPGNTGPKPPAIRAILPIDARKGVPDQTRRHSLHLLGTKHPWQSTKWSADYRGRVIFARGLGKDDLNLLCLNSCRGSIPESPLCPAFGAGRDNVAAQSANMRCASNRRC